jgi:hypothetical protein
MGCRPCRGVVRSQTLTLTLTPTLHLTLTLTFFSYPCCVVILHSFLRFLPQCYAVFPDNYPSYLGKERRTDTKDARTHGEKLLKTLFLFVFYLSLTRTLNLTLTLSLNLTLTLTLTPTLTLTRAFEAPRLEL